MTVLTDTQSTVKPSSTSKMRLAAIGLGERAAWITQLLTELDAHAELSVLVDPNPEMANERITKNKIRTADTIATFDSLDAMLNHGPDIDGIIIGARCHLHTPLAIKLASLNIPLFLEKPVCISWQQYTELEKTYADQCDHVVVSFPLRVTPLLMAVREYITQGRLGTINQIQAVNNVSYGNVYVDSWYRDYQQTGGLWLQKATHDFDYIHYLAGAKPLCVTAMHSRCVWQEPVLHQDAGSAIVQYDSGIHANYTQNFITRQSAGKRGATITGEDGTITFDWYTDQFTFHSHKLNRVENVTIKGESGHGGGDHILVRNFLDVMHKRDQSHTTLYDGLLSAGTCLAARDAANQQKVITIPTPFGEQKHHNITKRIEPLDVAV